jgi:small redox-active disulfide protein 2
MMMKKIQVLGPGCPKCVRLAELAGEAATELGLDYELEKVQDIEAIVDFGVFLTPGLVVDGEVKLSGRLPDLKELKKILNGE